MSEEDLKQILAAHKTWLETGREKGKQADLSRTNLQGANLVEASVRRRNPRFSKRIGRRLWHQTTTGGRVNFRLFRARDLKLWQDC